MRVALADVPPRPPRRGGRALRRRRRASDRARRHRPRRLTRRPRTRRSASSARSPCSANNAGVGILGSLEDAGYDDWDWGLGVNLGGVVNGLQTVVPRMRGREDGSRRDDLLDGGGRPDPGRRDLHHRQGRRDGAHGVRPPGAGEGRHRRPRQFRLPGPVQTNIRESGRLRPRALTARHGLRRAASARCAERPDVARCWMDALECGARRVLDGVRRGRPLHPHRTASSARARRSAATPSWRRSRTRRSTPNAPSESGS